MLYLSNPNYFKKNVSFKFNKDIKLTLQELTIDYNFARAVNIFLMTISYLSLFTLNAVQVVLLSNRNTLKQFSHLRIFSYFRQKRNSIICSVVKVD